jgi:hypothetical protein
MLYYPNSIYRVTTCHYDGISFLVTRRYSSFKIAGKLPQWAYWIIALAVFAVGWFGVGLWARHIAIRDLSASNDVWSPDGVLVEETDYTCVPASIVMLLKDYGYVTTTYKVALTAGTDIFGTSGSGIIKVAHEYGFSVKRTKMGFDEFLAQYSPGIIEFRVKGGKHAAYIMPITGSDQMKMMDPVDGLMFLSKSDAESHFNSTSWDTYLFTK